MYLARSWWWWLPFVQPPGCTQSLSDLEKLNVSEDLPEMERAEQLLKTGLDKQKISVLSSLPTILSSNNSKSNLLLILDCIKAGALLRCCCMLYAVRSAAHF